MQVPMSGFCSGESSGFVILIEAERGSGGSELQVGADAASPDYIQRFRRFRIIFL